mmetsp:Transcript_11335/g.15433  ORF Transcript_11335/g.15433 Transcript_11335/m.15433 type:complete len:215 (+) Transcript_11335:756-1400(+)
MPSKHLVADSNSSKSTKALPLDILVLNMVRILTNLTVPYCSACFFSSSDVNDFGSLVKNKLDFGVSFVLRVMPFLPLWTGPASLEVVTSTLVTSPSGSGSALVSSSFCSSSSSSSSFCSSSSSGCPSVAGSSSGAASGSTSSDSGFTSASKASSASKGAAAPSLCLAASYASSRSKSTALIPFTSRLRDFNSSFSSDTFSVEKFIKKCKAKLLL